MFCMAEQAPHWYDTILPDKLTDHTPGNALDLPYQWDAQEYVNMRYGALFPTPTCHTILYYTTITCVVYPSGSLDSCIATCRHALYPCHANPESFMHLCQQCSPWEYPFMGGTACLCHYMHLAYAAKANNIGMGLVVVTTVIVIVNNVVSINSDATILSVPVSCWCGVV